MEATFTVVIGSAGRPSLEATLESFVKQHPQANDSLVVIFDTHGKPYGWGDDQIKRAEAFPHVIAGAFDGGVSSYGVPQINRALKFFPLSGSHILTIGDDDIYLDGAFDIIRPVCTEAMDRPVLWRFLAPWREVLWDYPRMQMSRISGCCIAAPKQFVGQMPLRNAAGELYPEHDFDWMQAILSKSPAPIWLDEVLVVARPDASKTYAVERRQAMQA